MRGVRARRTLAAGALFVLLLVPASKASSATTDVLVTTVSDRLNGDISTVASLIANPGSDGISLPEAIAATNNDPGFYTIDFAPTLVGATISLDDDLPPLTGGNVAIEGGGVTLRSRVRWGAHRGIWLASSGNRLHSLTLVDFRTGVHLGPDDSKGPLPTREEFADNVVSGLVIRGADVGIGASSGSALPAMSQRRPRRTFNRFSNTTVSGNTIDARDSGIMFKLDSSGDRVERATVTGNTIRIRRGGDAAIALATGHNSVGARISDVLIARNSIAGPTTGISLHAGAIRGRAGIVERVRVLKNRMNISPSRIGWSLCGICVQAGNEPYHGIDPNVRPLIYPDGNVVRGILVRENSITGATTWGVTVAAGAVLAGARRNRIEDVRLERNEIRLERSEIRTSEGLSLPEAIGIDIKAGGGRRERYATANRITGVSIVSNRVTIGMGVRAKDIGASGIAVGAGFDFARENAVRNVRITRNTITTAYAGIRLIGGDGPEARQNSVRCVRLSGNRITGTRTPVSVLASPGNRASLGGC